MGYIENKHGRSILRNSGQWMAEGKNLIMIVVGIMIYAVGFTMFILPHQIVIGGMAGFGTLIFYASAGKIPVAVTMYGVNILLLAFSFRMLGKGFVMRTIFGATVMAVAVGALEGYFTSHPPLIEDTPVSVLMGAMLVGIGVGIYYSHGGTTGGTDIIAAIMTKISNVSVGRVMMIVDMSIVACSFFLPFDGDMEARLQSRAQTIIFGWMAIFLYSYVADKFIYQSRKTIQMIIISDKWHRIAERITHETGRGVTTWQGHGFWTGDEKTLMMVWCRQMDIYRIYAIVNAEDTSAYVTDCPVRSVYGNGFDTLRLKHRKS